MATSGSGKPDGTISAAMQNMLELTSRLDERMNTCIENTEKLAVRLEKFDDRVEKFMDTAANLSNRISSLEAKSNGKVSDHIEKLHEQSDRQDDDIEKVRLDINDIKNSVKNLQDANVKQEDRLKYWTDRALSILWAVITAWVLIKLGLSNKLP